MTRDEAQKEILADIESQLSLEVRFVEDPVRSAVAGEMLKRLKANEPLICPAPNAQD